MVGHSPDFITTQFAIIASGKPGSAWRMRVLILLLYVLGSSRSLSPCIRTDFVV